MHISGSVLNDLISIKENASIKNCFICNFDSCAISSNVGRLKIYIESCFFHSCESWSHGGAVSIQSAEETSVTKCFASSCCTKSTIFKEKIGQFGLLKVSLGIEGSNTFRESSFCWCAPFHDGYDRRSVVELCEGIIDVENVNFSNNFNTYQILRTYSEYQGKVSYVTYHNNNIKNDFIVYHSNGKITFTANQFFNNTIQADENEIAFSSRRARIEFFICSFQDLGEITFRIEEQCSINLKQCCFKTSIDKKGEGMLTIENNITITETLSHYILRDALESALKKRFFSYNFSRKHNLALIITLEFLPYF